MTADPLDAKPLPPKQKPLWWWSGWRDRLHTRRVAPRSTKSGAYLKTWGSTTPEKQARRAARMVQP